MSELKLHSASTEKPRDTTTNALESLGIVDELKEEQEKLEKQNKVKKVKEAKKNLTEKKKIEEAQAEVKAKETRKSMGIFEDVQKDVVSFASFEGKQFEVTGSAELVTITEKEKNEDTARIDMAHGVMVVCDGVGGESNSDVASNYTADEMQKFLASFDYDVDPKDLEVAVREKLTSVAKEVPEGATTLTAAKLLVDAEGKQKLLVTHVGDSELLIVDKDGKTIEKVTRNHSWLGDLERHLLDTIKKQREDFQAVQDGTSFMGKVKGLFSKKAEFTPTRKGLNKNVINALLQQINKKARLDEPMKQSEMMGMIDYYMSGLMSDPHFLDKEFRQLQTGNSPMNARAQELFYASYNTLDNIGSLGVDPRFSDEIAHKAQVKLVDLPEGAHVVVISDGIADNLDQGRIREVIKEKRAGGAGRVLADEAKANAHKADELKKEGKRSMYKGTDDTTIVVGQFSVKEAA